MVIVAALGAFAGDHISFFGGRAIGGRAIDSIRPGTRRRRALDRAAPRWTGEAA